MKQQEATMNMASATCPPPPPSLAPVEAGMLLCSPCPPQGRVLSWN